MKKESFVFTVLFLSVKMTYGQTIFDRDERSLLNLNKTAIHNRLIARNYKLDTAQGFAPDSGKVYSFYRRNIKSEDDFYIVIFANKMEIYPTSIIHNLSNNKRFIELRNSFTRGYPTAKGKIIKRNGCTIFTVRSVSIYNKIYTVIFSTCSYTLPYHADESPWILDTHSCEILIEN